MPPRITRNHEYAKILSRTVKDNRGFTTLASKVDTIDSADVIQIASGITANTLEIYDTLDSLPTSSLTKGGQGYVKATQRLYVSDSFGWYSAALVNLTPTQTLDPAGNVTLATDGTATVVTITAQDSDNPDSHLTYSVESDGNGIGQYSLSQDSSVFTITPLTADSGGTETNFTLTFKTTDGINIASTGKDFSLSFITTVDSSSSTVFLMKAAGNNSTNAAITYQNSSDVSTGFTEAGTPQASTFTPYRSGGYSAYFDGTGDYVAPSTTMNVSTGDFTMEAWVYPTASGTASASAIIFIGDANVSSGSDIQAGIYWTSDNKFVCRPYSGATDYNMTSGALSLNQWYHVTLVRNGNDFKGYVDGVQIGSTRTITGSLNAATNTYIGYWQLSSVAQYFTGYVTDARVVTGTAVYTSTFTPPTERLTAIANTSLLTCHLPYFADGSTNGLSITVNGDAKTVPFGPYDYEPWVADDHGGSTFFDGSSDMTAFSLTSIAAGNYTVEFWCYPTKNLTDQQTLLHFREASGNGGTNIWFGGSSGANIRVDNGLAGQSSFTGKALVLNTWNHIALTRNSTTTTCYINGVSAGSHTYTPAASNRLTIGRFTATPYYFNGYLSDVRYTAGSVVYSAAFTPPAAPLGHITNTNLLMNNKSDANIYDASSSSNIRLTGNTITKSGSGKFSTSSSVYFDDGTNGLHISTPVDASTGPLSQLEFFTGDFTIEYWLYPTTWYSNDAFMGYGWWSGQQGSFALYTTSTSTVSLYSSSTGSSWNLKSAAAAFSTWTNSWKHFAMTYDASADSLVFYLDGVVQSTHTGLSGWQNSGGGHELDINQLNNNTTDRGAYAGYIQDMRISKKVRYTGAFTPPTAEFEL